MITLHLTDDMHATLLGALHDAIDDLAEHIAHDDTHPGEADADTQAARRETLAERHALLNLAARAPAE